MKHLTMCCVALLMVGCDEPVVGNDGGLIDAGVVVYDTPAKVQAFLSGKTLVMAAADMPTHSNGFSENLYLAGNSQCFNEVKITVSGDFKFTVASKTGTYRSADGGVFQSEDGGTPAVGTLGLCDRSAAGTTLMFNSNTVSIPAVTSGTCFDIDVPYMGYSQNGRGQISADGKQVKMELFIAGQATSHRCADGAVGAAGVQFKPGAAAATTFTGNAVQTYVVQ